MTSRLNLPTVLHLLIALLFAFGALTAHAAAPKPINTDPKKLIGWNIKGTKLTAAEAYMLEPVCVLVLSNGRNDEQWYDVLKGNPILDLPQYNMAKGAISLHHYCYGEVAKNHRLFTTDSKKKAFLVSRMLDEYGFVLHHEAFHSKNWPYMKKVYLEYGKAAVLAKQVGEALTAFNKALDLDPGYEPAIIALEEMQSKIHNEKSVLPQVTEGLRHHPDSEALQKLYVKLGGQLPYPTPYKQKEEPQQAASQSDQTASPPPTDQAGDNSVGTQPESADQDNAPPETPADPKHPFCRFCP